MTENGVAQNGAVPDPLFDQTIWQYHVRRAAEHLHEQYQDNERFPKAWKLATNQKVTLHSDGTATVLSGDHNYQIDGNCPCEDAQYRTKFCKHYLAAEITKLATDLMAASQSPDQHVVPIFDHADPPETPVIPHISSAHWQVNEAPAACTLKFQVSGVDILYTMRDVNDDALFARIKRILPRVQAKAQETQEQLPKCPIHNVPMSRFTKNGRSWWAHQTVDGQWCRGSQKRNSKQSSKQ